MEMVALIIGLSAIYLAALLWGADSRDSVNSSEWERRHQWRGFGR